MAIFNRVVNVIILVLAIVAVVFGYFLFEKREQLVNRGHLFAEYIIKVAKALDANSGTKISDDIKNEKYETNPRKNPKLADDQKKSLYHTNYPNLRNVLEPFHKHSLAIGSQRDTLAVSLKDVAEKLELRETFSSSNFQEIASYTENCKKLLELVAKLNARDNAIMKQIADSAGVIGFTLDKETLKDLDNYKTPLYEFASKVDALKKRSDTYADNLVNVGRILQIQAPSLAGDDYSSELNTMINAVQGVKDDFEKTKRELARIKDELEKTRDSLNKAIAEKEKAIKERDDWKKRYIAVTNPGDSSDEVKPVDIPTHDALIQKLEGKILEVNPRWNFVVIDLGKNNKITVPIGPTKIKDELVPLPEGRTMVVGRDDKYIGKIKITTVNEHCAIANIIPDENGQEVEPGDKVFFAKNIKEASPTEGKGTPAGGTNLPNADADKAAPAAAEKAAPEAVAPATAKDDDDIGGDLIVE